MNESMGLIGRKLGMIQLFAADGAVIPCSVVEAGPNVILQIKAGGADGYAALQVGFGKKKERLANKPESGHAKAADTAVPQHVREIRVDAAAAAKYTRGQALGVADVFALGELVDVAGDTRGRGFAGVMKKHHMSGFKRSHGVHEYFRHGGSVGTRLTPGMTLAGKKMPARMGGVQRTIQNLEIVKVDVERNLLFLRGAVPGAPGTLLTVRHRVKNVKGTK